MEIIINISINIILILITIVVGLVLHRIGKPYSGFYFAIHKVTTIAFIVFMTIIVIQFLKVYEAANFLITFVVITIVAIIALLVSGALLSNEKWDELMQKTHKISTLLFLIGSLGIFYFLLK